MANILIQLSKYLIIILMAAYTFSCFSIFTRNYEDEETPVLIRQDVLMFLILCTSFGAMYLAEEDMRIIFIGGALAVVLMAVILLYNLIYPNVSRLVVNNMCMLMTAGMVMITRLSSDNPSPYGSSVRQLIFIILGVIFGLVVPILIKKLTFLEQWTYIYAAVGGAALLAVALFGGRSGGAKLSFDLGLVNIQPSEFVKIIFVFYVAASLKASVEFKNVVVTTAVAAAHVLILVVSTDLGAALIFFIVYLVMLYVATRQPLYALAGIAAGCGAAVVGYHLFSHIRVRVEAWQDPFATYSGGGYQIAQSLFGIGSGSWFGTGLFQGQPGSIPVSETDFIFSAITEEMGVIFGLCLILVCVSCYVMFLNIAMELRDQFYKLVALGLGTCYIFQVFLQIGGVTKFIPLTGLTLPLVSYGGSSMLSTMIMFGIIQGLYIVREDEEAKIEIRKEREFRDVSGRTTRKKAAENKPRFEEVPKQRTRQRKRAHSKQRVR
ncbi:MAG TPA: FtsW/RodA/SpoVE family cell cycle protein [Candidatus Mediterraneibacter stercoripullorum]|nr:FtsW/RodA/SpoVE family cell cycle protein [Candidatus Mediterraneibacter stercoripullorum]